MQEKEGGIPYFASFLMTQCKIYGKKFGANPKIYYFCTGFSKKTTNNYLKYKYYEKDSVCIVRNVELHLR